MTRALERKILEMIRASERAVSPDTIVHLTKATEDDVSRTLGSMQKYGQVRIVTKKVVRYYK